VGQSRYTVIILYTIYLLLAHPIYSLFALKTVRIIEMHTVDCGVRGGRTLLGITDDFGFVSYMC